MISNPDRLYGAMTMPRPLQASLGAARARACRFSTLALLVGAVAVIVPCPAAMAEDKKPVTSHEIKSPRDAASGQATGKRMHKPAGKPGSQGGHMTTLDGSTSREAGSGMATGRRQHEPLNIRMRPTSLAGVKNLCAGTPNCQIVGENANSVGFCVGNDCVLASRKSGGAKVEYLKVEMKEVFVSSFSSRQAPAGRPMSWTGVSGILSPAVMGASPKPPKIDVPKPAKVDVPKVSAPAGNLGVKDIKVNTVR
jgi:hypothetical protein